MITKNDIVQAVESTFELTSGTLLSRSRRSEIVIARKVAMYLCRQHTLSSYPDIGTHFNRTHSGVIAAFREIRDELAYNKNSLTALATKEIIQKLLGANHD